jgi:hypothetical protein
MRRHEAKSGQGKSHVGYAASSRKPKRHLGLSDQCQGRTLAPSISYRLATPTATISHAHAWAAAQNAGSVCTPPLVPGLECPPGGQCHG